MRGGLTGEPQEPPQRGAVHGAASEEPETQVRHLTEQTERQRMAELFSDGSGVPAVPPDVATGHGEGHQLVHMLALHVSRSSAHSVACSAAG